MPEEIEALCTLDYSTADIRTIVLPNSESKQHAGE